ncbi:MAG: hypothetical protein RL685_1783 [Pseudomonadota bacterium]|jgi:hypothetical protein
MKTNLVSVGAAVAVACVAVLGGACSSEGSDDSRAQGMLTPGPAGEGMPGSRDAAEGMGSPGAADPTQGGAAAPGTAGGTATSSGTASEGPVAPSGLSGTEGSGNAGSGEPGAAPVVRPEFAYAATVENTGAGCEVGELPEAAALPRLERLPNPFTKLDGTTLASTAEWRCRRQELLQQAEKYIYGEKPPKPERVTGSVTTDTVSVQVEHEGKSIEFSARVVLPPGDGPFPAIINLGANGITLGESLVLEQGVAVIYYNHYDLGQEGQPEMSRGLPNPGRFYDLYGGDHSAGLLMAWAWGASRLLDVLQESGGSIIDPERVGVTGCSRNGKGAFTVGVFDERIALTIPQETSTGGLPAYRIVDVTNGAERTNWNYNGLNWLSNVFAPFVENATQLPIDSHEMVAMVAPRGLLVLDNPHVAQFAASSAHTAVLAGAEVYRALGATDNVSYISDVVNETHCASGKPEYTEAIVQSIGKFLKHEPGAPGVLRAGATGAGDLAAWRDWETPTLQSADSTD